MLWQPWAAQIRPNALELTAIDVGQGDSLLVSFPDKSLMLIDGGGVLSYGRDQKPRLDTGEDVVSSYLWSRGIRRLNIVAVTHAHEDHMGGIASVLRNFHPQELWVGAHPSPELLALAEELKIAVKRPAAPGSLSYGGTDIQVLSPFPDHPFNEGNNDSLVLRIAYGQRAMLLTGDIEKPIEDWLLSLSESLPVAAQDLTAKNPPAESPESAVLPEDIPSGQTNRNQVLRADILKVAHHGSRTSTSEAFLAAVSPSVVAVSAGFQNSFGHPNRAVLERLEERHIPVLRTDLDGLVTIGTDGKRVWFDKKVWHPGQGDFGFSWAEAEGR
jgi:competence protein ComEC